MELCFTIHDSYVSKQIKQCFWILPQSKYLSKVHLGLNMNTRVYSLITLRVAESLSLYTLVPRLLGDQSWVPTCWRGSGRCDSVSCGSHHCWRWASPSCCGSPCGKSVCWASALGGCLSTTTRSCSWWCRWSWTCCWCCRCPRRRSRTRTCSAGWPSRWWPGGSPAGGGGGAEGRRRHGTELAAGRPWEMCLGLAWDDVTMWPCGSYTGGRFTELRSERSLSSTELSLGGSMVSRGRWSIRKPLLLALQERACCGSWCLCHGLIFRVKRPVLLRGVDWPQPQVWFCAGRMLPWPWQSDRGGHVLLVDEQSDITVGCHHLIVHASGCPAVGLHLIGPFPLHLRSSLWPRGRGPRPPADCDSSVHRLWTRPETWPAGRRRPPVPWWRRSGHSASRRVRHHVGLLVNLDISTFRLHHGQRGAVFCHGHLPPLESRSCALSRDLQRTAASSYWTGRCVWTSGSQTWSSWDVQSSCSSDTGGRLSGWCGPHAELWIVHHICAPASPPRAEKENIEYLICFLNWSWSFNLSTVMRTRGTLTYSKTNNPLRLLWNTCLSWRSAESS